MANTRPISPALEKKKRKLPEVKVADINMSFGSMMRFMIKWSFASIPAIIVLMLVYSFFFSFLLAIVKH